MVLLGCWASHPKLIGCLLAGSIGLRLYIIYNPIGISYLAWFQSFTIYLPMFLWGMFCSVLKVDQFVGRLKPAVTYMLFVILTVLLINFCIQSTSRLRGDVVTALWLLGLYFILSCKLNLRSHRWIDSIDTHSMNIYIIHHVLIWAALIFIPGMALLMDRLYLWGPVLLFVIILPLSWGLSLVAERYWLTSLLFHPIERSRNNLKGYRA